MTTYKGINKMTHSNNLIVANIIAVSDSIMREVSGGEELSDAVNKDGEASPFCEATAITVNNHLNNGGM